MSDKPGEELAGTNSSSSSESDQDPGRNHRRVISVEQGQVNVKDHPIPHGQWRLGILSAALAGCLVAGWSHSTPSDSRTTFLSMASAIITALVRPFDR